LQAFQKAKDAAKVEYRRLAFELHPDRGGDPEKFKEISALWDKLQKIELKPVPQVRRVSIVTRGMPFVTVVGVGWRNTTTIGTTTASSVTTDIDYW
jgi:hypothetical protein